MGLILTNWNSVAAPAPASAFLSAPANGGIEMITNSSRNKKKKAQFVRVLTRSSRPPVCISVSLGAIQAGRPLPFHSYTSAGKRGQKKRFEVKNRAVISGNMQSNNTTFGMKTIPLALLLLQSKRS